MKTFAAFALAFACALDATAQQLPNWFQVSGGKWEVPDEVALEAAAALRSPDIAALPKNRRPLRDMSSYTVQYQGILVDGERMVRLGGACSLFGRTADSLRASWLVVFDGGDCYYDATYDPAAKRITAIRTHGYA